jgi:hypothetical protein
MTPATKHKPTDGALRAAKQIEHNPSLLQSSAEIIDRETGVRELVEMLENIIEDDQRRHQQRSHLSYSGVTGTGSTEAMPACPGRPCMRARFSRSFRARSCWPSSS